MLAGVLLVALIAAFVISRQWGGTSQHGHGGVPSARGSTGTFVVKGPAIDFGASDRGSAVLQDLGLRLTISADLARQGLMGIPGADPSRSSSSRSISFALKALADRDSACIADGAQGWLGTLTRYDSPSTAMADHTSHMIATFDYPGFHTTYRAVTQSCAARRKSGSTIAELADEKHAASELWNAIRTAQPIGR